MQMTSQMKYPTVMTEVAFTLFNLECVCTMGVLYNAVNKI